MGGKSDDNEGNENNVWLLMKDVVVVKNVKSE